MQGRFRVGHSGDTEVRTEGTKEMLNGKKVNSLCPIDLGKYGRMLSPKDNHIVQLSE